jgi:CubicO group peptidase (beta-lactamase class C family)
MAIAAAAVVATPATAHRHPPPKPDHGHGARFDPRSLPVQSWLDTYLTPGASVGVVKSGRDMFSAGYGKRAVDEPGRVDENTIFELGSESKTFAAWAVGILMREGKVNLDEQLIHYLPWFRWTTPELTQAITVRDVMLMKVAPVPGTAARLFADSNRELITNLSFAKPSALPYPSPKETYNTNLYSILSSLVESVSGESYARFMEERIFGPIGMRDSAIGWSRWRQTQNRAESHDVVRDVPGTEIQVAAPYYLGGHAVRMANMAPDPRYYNNVAQGANNVHTTAHDMQLYMKTLLNDGVAPNGRRVLPAGLFQEFTSPASGIETVCTWPVCSLFDPNETTYATLSAFYTTTYRGYPAIWKSGDSYGQASEMWLVPGQKLGVATQTNATYYSGYAHAMTSYTLLDGYLGLTPTPNLFEQVKHDHQYGLYGLDDRDPVAEVLATRVPGNAPSLPLTAYAGSFHDNGQYGDLRVSFRHGRLALTAGRLTATLLPWNGDQFLVQPDAKDKLTDKANFIKFVVADGAVATVELFGSSFVATDRLGGGA